MRRQTYRRESYRRRRPDDPQVILRERKPQTYWFKDDGVTPTIRAGHSSSTDRVSPIQGSPNRWFLFLVWFVRRRRQLKNGGPLTSVQQRQQHNLTIGKFQGIMMHVLLVLIDLPKEACCASTGARAPEPTGLGSGKPWPPAPMLEVFYLFQVSAAPALAVSCTSR